MKLRLGDVSFDSDARQLSRSGKEIHLSPKAFDLLGVLITARPRVLTKNELHQSLWPDTFVSDTNLASLIAEIREALDDDAREPRFVRTAPRVGYAFCGAATEVSGSAPQATANLCWLIKDGRRIPLLEGENILGREGEGDIQIDSTTVSRRHARIEVSAERATIEDLDSKNGTFLRGERVSAVVPLFDGNEIRVGSVVLVFRTASGSRTATWSEPRGASE